MTSKSALITGITGMDGRLLADLLLSKGYNVFGLYRNNQAKTFIPIERVSYIEADLSNLPPLDELFIGYHFDEIYNLGAQTFINPSWEDPEYTLNVNCLSIIKFLNYIKDYSPKTKFFSASSSEIFSGTSESPQNENTPYAPTSPYGTSKVFANNIIKNYREKYNIFACSGILYTHEDVTRNEYYVSKKISKGVSEINLGISDSIVLGDIDASRDWLSAKDAVRAIWMILQQESPRDFVISSGVSRTIKDFISSSFGTVNISDWEKYISIDQDLIRSKQKVKIVGDNSDLSSIGWSPEISFQQMVEELVLHEIKKLSEVQDEKNILSN
jgi:GDPmannose 4,6-dehydratase